MKWCVGVGSHVACHWEEKLLRISSGRVWPWSWNWIGLGFSWPPTWRYESAAREVSYEERRRSAKRFWTRHKTQAVLRLLRGDDIDLVSRELGVGAPSFHGILATSARG